MTAFDLFNNVATGYTGTVHFTSSDGAASLPLNHTFVVGDAGTFSTSATLDTAGSQTITVTDTGSGTLTANAHVTVNAAAINHLSLSAPGSSTAGNSLGVTVTAFDLFNNVATGYTGTVHFTSSDGAASLPLNHTFVVGDAGTFSTSATLDTAGPQTITVTDTGSGTLTANAHVAVSAGFATRLTIHAPSSATAGFAFAVTVTALDQFNNVAKSYTGMVHYTSSDGAAVLPGDHAFSNSDAGSFTANATLFTEGNQTLKVTDSANGSLTATADITVSRASTTHLFVSAPLFRFAGLPFTVSVALWINLTTWLPIMREPSASQVQIAKAHFPPTTLSFLATVESMCFISKALYSRLENNPSQPAMLVST